MLNQEFDLTPSRYYLALISIFLFTSLVIILCLPIEYLLKLCVFLMVLAYGAFVMRRYGLLSSPRSIRKLQRQADGQWLLETNQGACEAQLCPDSTVTSVVSVLRFHAPERRFEASCIVFRDSLPRDRYRQLLVALRMF